MTNLRRVLRKGELAYKDETGRLFVVTSTSQKPLLPEAFKELQSMVSEHHEHLTAHV